MFPGAIERGECGVGRNDIIKVLMMKASDVLMWFCRGDRPRILHACICMMKVITTDGRQSYLGLATLGPFIYSLSNIARLHQDLVTYLLKGFLVHTASDLLNKCLPHAFNRSKIAAKGNGLSPLSEWFSNIIYIITWISCFMVYIH